MPMHICTSVDGPLGNRTFDSPWPITRGALQTQITYETSTASIARPMTRFAQGGNWSIGTAASG